METKLYRATNRKADGKKIPAGSCWTPEADTAEAYRHNQGFGGKYIITISLPGDLLIGDYTDEAGGVDRLIEDYGQDDDESEQIRESSQGYVFTAIEELGWLARRIAEKYDWIKYTDNYPDGATTYRRM